MESKDSFNFSSSIGVKAPPSPWLIFHVHGGGFVAQSRHARIVLPNPDIIFTFCLSAKAMNHTFSHGHAHQEECQVCHYPTMPVPVLSGFLFDQRDIVHFLPAVAAVNYDLAPQKQFPTQVLQLFINSSFCFMSTRVLQLHQCLHAWAWIHQHPSSFGWTGERSDCLLLNPLRG
jgi:hypothetical protein